MQFRKHLPNYDVSIFLFDIRSGHNQHSRPLEMQKRRLGKKGKSIRLEQIKKSRRCVYVWDMAGKELDWGGVEAVEFAFKNVFDKRCGNPPIRRPCKLPMSKWNVPSIIKEIDLDSMSPFLMTQRGGGLDWNLPEQIQTGGQSRPKRIHKIPIFLFHLYYLIPVCCLYFCSNHCLNYCFTVLTARGAIFLSVLNDLNVLFFCPLVVNVQHMI